MFRPRELLLLRALHETGSVTAAATAVHLSQPAASALIRAIETRIGFDLFTRERRRLALSANGRALLPELLNAAAALESADRLARDLRAGWTTRLTIGAVPVVGTSLLPAAIAALRASDAAVRVAIRTGSTVAVAAMAADQRIDLGVIIGSVTDDRLAIRRLAALRLCGVLAPADPRARRPRLTLRQIVAAPYVALSRELPAGAATARMLEAAGLAYEPAIEATQTASACALVDHGAGAAIIESTGAAFARRLGLVVRNLQPVPALALNLVWSASRGLSRPAASFRAEIAARVDAALRG
ncbi:MAG: LysR family transcriptional regulator [Lautropia sp.]